MADDDARFALDGDKVDLYQLWAEARTKRLLWEAQEKAAREQIIALFADTTGKAVVGEVNSKPVVRLSRISYFTLDQPALRRHYPEIYETFNTKEISFDRLDYIGKDDVELAG